MSILPRPTRQVAVELFAASLLEIIPKCEFIETRATKLGFQCKVKTPFALSKKYLDLVRDRFLEKVRKGVEFRVMEMVPKVAVQFLKAHHQYLRAEKVDFDEELVEVLQSHNYVNLLEGEVNLDLQEIGEIFLEEEGGVVSGFVFAGKAEMKAFQKGRRSFVDPIQKGIDKNFFKLERGGIVWQPLGIEVREEITNEIVNLVKTLGYRRVEATGWERKLSKKEFELCVVEGDPEGEFGLMDRFCHHLIRAKAESESSSLLLIDKLSKIFPQNCGSVTDEFGLVWKFALVKNSIVEIYIDRIVNTRL